MAEEYALTDPSIIPEIVTSKYKVVSLNLNMESPFAGIEPGLVLIELKDNNDVRTNYTYEGQQAIDMMKWMNTANFTVNSMQKRILQKLSNDGKLPPGDITGTPDTPPTDF
jgi:hypothetical protein